MSTDADSQAIGGYIWFAVYTVHCTLYTVHTSASVQVCLWDFDSDVCVCVGYNVGYNMFAGGTMLGTICERGVQCEVQCTYSFWGVTTCLGKGRSPITRWWLPYYIVGLRYYYLLPISPWELNFSSENQTSLVRIIIIIIIIITQWERPASHIQVRIWLL